MPYLFSQGQTERNDWVLRLDLMENAPEIIDGDDRALVGGGTAFQGYDTLAPRPVAVSDDTEAALSSWNGDAIISFTFSFDERVSGIDRDDFILTRSNPSDGESAPLSSAAIFSPRRLGETDWIVPVNARTAFAGVSAERDDWQLHIALKKDSSVTQIQDLAGNFLLISDTADAMSYTAAQSYANTPPEFADPVFTAETPRVNLAARALYALTLNFSEPLSEPSLASVRSACACAMMPTQKIPTRRNWTSAFTMF